MSSVHPLTKLDLSLQSIDGYLKEPQRPAKLIALLASSKDQPISFHVTIRPPETLLETLTEVFILFLSPFPLVSQRFDDSGLGCFTGTLKKEKAKGSQSSKRSRE
jgi:hypothetical protein